MLTICLHQLRFTAFHGLWEGEQVLGNEFEVDLSVKHSPKNLPVKQLADTVDYIAVYNLVKKRMAVPAPLLEILAADIARDILERFDMAESVSVAIRKLHPPAEQFIGSVGITFDMNRQQL